MLPIFAKAPCCLELFGCCCRRHSAATLLAGCFFCVCVCTAQFCFGLLMRCLFLGLFALAVDRFVTIGRRTAQFCFSLLMRCLFLGSPLRPPRLLTRQLCGSGCVCRPEFSIIRLKNNSIYLKPDESFVYIGGRVSIS